VRGSLNIEWATKCVFHKHPVIEKKKNLSLGEKIKIQNVFGVQKWGVLERFLSLIKNRIKQREF